MFWEWKAFLLSRTTWNFLHVQIFLLVDNGLLYARAMPWKGHSAGLHSTMNINFILGLLCLVVYFYPFHSFIDCLCLFVWIIIMLTACAAFLQLVQCWDNRHFILGQWVWGAPVESTSQFLDRRQVSDYNCLPTLLCKDFVIFPKVDVDTCLQWGYQTWREYLI